MRISPIAASLGAVALFGLTGVAQAAPRDPSGVWLTEAGEARIRIEKCGAQNTNICGYAVWLKIPLNSEGKPRVDFRNPDVKKQARPSLGHQMIMGLTPNADGRYEGKIYNAENGKYYDVTIWTEAAGELSVRGCMMGFLCGSQSWTQKADVLPGQLTGPTNGANGPRADAEWTPKAPPAVASRSLSPATTGATSPKQTAGAQPSKPAAQKPKNPATAEEQPED